MWVVVSEDGTPLAKFPAGRTGWDKAIRWATMNGGEFEIMLVLHVG